MKLFLSVAVLLTSVFFLTADEASNAENNRSEGRTEGRSRFGGRGGMRSQGGRRGGNFMEQIKNKYPTEYAEIEKMRESNPEKARDLMRDLMFKNMSAMGMGRSGDRKERSAEPVGEQLEELKSKFPTEFAEYEKLKTTDAAKAAEKLKELMKKAFPENAVADTKNLRDRNRRAVGFVMRDLERRYPERMAAINKLQKTDPDAARKQLRELFSEAGISMPGGARELNYEDVPANTQPNRNGMMPGGNFPFGGGRMMMPGSWGGRR